MYKLFFLGTVVLISLALMGGQISENPAPADAVDNETKTAKISDEPSVADGIQVHGHWLIEILDEDGKSVNVTEFDNALISTFPLTKMMGLAGFQYGSYGGWQVRIWSDNLLMCGVSSGCIISNTNTTCGFHPVHSSNLSIGLVETTPGFEKIVLSGSIVAPETATVHRVFAGLKVCETSVLPSDCASNNSDCTFIDLTMALLPSPPTVQAGQQILVTVEISFS